MSCRPWLLRVLVALPLVGGMVYLCAGVWHDWVGPPVRAYLDRQQVRAEDARRLARHRADPGLLGELVGGRIGRGYRLAEITAAHAPTRKFQAGPYTDLHYNLGDGGWLWLCGRDGELVGAEWTWQAKTRPPPPWPFLRDELLAMTPAEQAAHHAAARLRYEDRRAAHMAGGGPLGYIAHYELTP